MKLSIQMPNFALFTCLSMLYILIAQADSLQHNHHIESVSRALEPPCKSLFGRDALANSWLSSNAVEKKQVTPDSTVNSHFDTPLIRRIHGEERIELSDPWIMTREPVARFIGIKIEIVLVLHGYLIDPTDRIMIMAVGDDLLEDLTSTHGAYSVQGHIQHITYACVEDHPTQIQTLRSRLAFYFGNIPVSEYSYPYVNDLSHFWDFLAVQNIYISLTRIEHHEPDESEDSDPNQPDQPHNVPQPPIVPLIGPHEVSSSDDEMWPPPVLHLLGPPPPLPAPGENLENAGNSTNM